MNNVITILVILFSCHVFFAEQIGAVFLDVELFRSLGSSEAASYLSLSIYLFSYVLRSDTLFAFVFYHWTVCLTFFGVY